MSTSWERARTESLYSAIRAGGDALSGKGQNIVHVLVARLATVRMREGFLIAAYLFIPGRAAQATNSASVGVAEGKIPVCSLPVIKEF